MPKEFSNPEFQMWNWSSLSISSLRIRSWSFLGHWWVIAGSLVILLSTGCYRQQMANQPSYHSPDHPSEFFADGQANRPLVEGTIARGQLHEDAARYTGKTGDRYVAEFPYQIDSTIVTRGRDRFNIYCSMCHGRVGRGDGKVVERGYIKPPSYLTDDARGYVADGKRVPLREVPVGYIFDVITHGHGAMPAYETQIPSDDRWAIISYVRALQLSQHVPAAELTATDKIRLEESKSDR
jgi:mono/diheme cytochrome c family protein